MLKLIGFLFAHPLTKNIRIYTFFKFLYWQIYSSFIKEDKVFDWVNRSKLNMKKGETSVTGNYYSGFIEFYDMSFLLHFLAKEDIFIDVGSNSGVYTVLASKAIGSKTVTFEPIKSSFDRLKGNIKLNGISDNVVAVNKGVGSKIEKLRFYNNLGACNRVAPPGCYKKTSIVDLTTIDNEFDFNLDYSYVLKIDVEGFEMNVLKGAKNLLKSKKILAIIIETNGNNLQFGTSNSDIHNILCSFGYFAIKYSPFDREIKAIKSINNAKNNTIYIVDIEKTRERCIKSNKFIVHSARDYAI